MKTTSEKNWVCSDPSFKPLFDLLKDGNLINQQFYKNTKKPSLQNFVMSPEIAYEAQRIAQDIVNQPEKNALLFNKVKLPYDEVLIEMPLTDEVKKLRNPRLNLQDNLLRIGAYIKTQTFEDKLFFIFSPYWGFENGLNTHSLIQVYVYFENNQTFVEPKYIKEISDLLSQPTSDKTKYDDFKKSFVLLASEACDEISVLLIAWCILVNSKSGIEKTKIPEIKLSSKFGKRKQKAKQRSAYTIVSLSEVEKIDCNKNIVCKIPIPAHRVRGHFKIRKNGIFWWRPFVRGTGELIERSGYKLVA